MYITSDTEKSKYFSHDRYRTSEHNETNAHWRIFFRLILSDLIKSAFISASVNIVQITIGY